MRSILMNEEKWLFIGTDKRLFVCSKLMKKVDMIVDCIKTNRYTVELRRTIIEFNTKHIVFPIFEMQGTIPVIYLRKVQVYIQVLCPMMD